MAVEEKVLKYSGTRVQELLSEIMRMLEKQRGYYISRRDTTDDLNECMAWDQMRKKNEEVLAMLDQCSKLLRWS